MALAQEALRLATKNAGLLGLIGAPTYSMLRDVTQRTFFEILEQNQIRYTFRKQENHLTLFPWRSEVIFRSLDNPERLRGTNLAWFGIDEMTYCLEAAFLRLQARLRHPQAKELCGFGAWTPAGFDWVYEKFIAEPKPDYEAVLASPRENSYLPTDFYDQLAQSYDRRFAEQEIEGKYLNIFSGQVYYAFDRTKNIQAVEYDPTLPLCWSLDFNIDPMCSVIAQIEDRSTRVDTMTGRRVVRINVLDELFLRNANTPQACREFVNRTQNWQRGAIHVHVYGDASGHARQTAGAGTRTDYETIRQFFAGEPGYRLTFRTKTANPAVKDRVNAMNAALCNSRGERKCFIHPRCKGLIRDLERVVWKPGTTLIDKDTDGQLSHMSDAAGYLIETELPLRGTIGYRSERIL